MASQFPAPSEAAYQQQGDQNALPHQSGAVEAPQQEQSQNKQPTPIFRDFASI